MDTARELGMSDFIREGVYVHVSGPSYETPAESRFLEKVGADSVGMSTAPEVVVAKHCGLKVLGKWGGGVDNVREMVVQEVGTESRLYTHTHRSLLDHKPGCHVV